MCCKGPTIPQCSGGDICLGNLCDLYFISFGQFCLSLPSLGTYTILCRKAQHIVPSTNATRRSLPPNHYLKISFLHSTPYRDNPSFHAFWIFPANIYLRSTKVLGNFCCSSYSLTGSQLPYTVSGQSYLDCMRAHHALLASFAEADIVRQVAAEFRTSHSC